MTKRGKVSFSYIASHDIDHRLPVERVYAGDDFVRWGSTNRHPERLYEKFTLCPTLNTIITGTSDYVMGNGMRVNDVLAGFAGQVNVKRDDLRDIVSRCVLDLILFGGFTVQVIYNLAGEIAELYYVDIRNCRLSEDESHVYFSKKWGSSLSDYEKYPAFDPENKVPTQILFYKGSNTRGFYPVPAYYAAMTAIETEIEIQKFHYNSIINNFACNVIVNINNGIPSDEEKEEFEKDFTDKYTGTDNTGRALFSYNENKEQAATIERINDDNFDKKYEALAKTTRQNIYASFRAIPAIFGIMTETTGFSEQEFTEAFNLYNRTVIYPRQQEMIRVFDYLFSVENSLSFVPFSLNTENDG
ncbi:MAG: hypothetical protein LUG98_10000 [Tannerellaceae bacterium]|nr:hypothetical protein [Tannerellaceae bacterium]